VLNQRPIGPAPSSKLSWQQPLPQQLYCAATLPNVLAYITDRPYPVRIHLGGSASVVGGNPPYR